MAACGSQVSQQGTTRTSVAGARVEVVGQAAQQRGGRGVGEDGTGGPAVRVLGNIEIEFSFDREHRSGRIGRGVLLG